MDPREVLAVAGASGEPLYDQLRNRVIEGVRSGTLPPGTKMPTVRDLAAQLGIAANTVARAYRELESAGIVETRGRLGTFIARADPTDAAMAEAATTYLGVARALGLSRAEAVRYLAAIPEGPAGSVPPSHPDQT